MKRILAIDDNPLDNMINEMLLRRSFPDYERIFYTNPSEALDFLKQNKDNLPDLILLDVNMPLVSGWDVVRELATTTFNGNVFMLTSSISHEDEQHAGRFHFIRGYFIKPLKDEMIQRMKDHLSARPFSIFNQSTDGKHSDSHT